MEYQKYFKVQTSPEIFSVISKGLLKFPSSSQALDLFMGDSGTSPIRLLLRIPSLFCFLLSKSLKARSNVSSSPSNSSTKVLGKTKAGLSRLGALKGGEGYFNFNSYLSPSLNLEAPLHLRSATYLPLYHFSFHEFSHLLNAKKNWVSPFPIVPKDRPHPVASAGRTFESRFYVTCVDGTQVTEKLTSTSNFGMLKLMINTYI